MGKAAELVGKLISISLQYHIICFFYGKRLLKLAHDDIARSKKLPDVSVRSSDYVDHWIFECGHLDLLP